MLTRSQAIVLHTIRYGESSIVVQAFTQKYGRLGFMANGVRSRKGGSKMALYQPFSYLDVQFYYKEKEQLMRIREAEPMMPLHALYSDVQKTSLALFVCEVTGKCIREYQPDSQLWQLLIESVTWLDGASEGLGMFHLAFLARFTQILGVEPDFAPDSLRAFLPLGTNGVPDEDIINCIRNIYQLSFQQIFELSYDYAHRMNMLRYMLQYLHHHFGGLLPVQTLDVFYEVFRK